MLQIIDRMVADFEKGKLNRRQLASALMGLVAVSANAATNSSDFKAVNINHVTMRVADIKRSTQFYEDVFGIPAVKTSATVNVLKINTDCYLGLEAANGKTCAVDHLSFGIQSFKSEDAAAKLTKRGLKKLDVSKDGIKFHDPDDILVQFGAADYVPSVPK
jgi:catechol 2,3-dioxygenase-like lactoylglutathione lyase family enzyme